MRIETQIYMVAKGSRKSAPLDFENFVQKLWYILLLLIIINNNENLNKKFWKLAWRFSTYTLQTQTSRIILL